MIDTIMTVVAVTICLLVTGVIAIAGWGLFKDVREDASRANPESTKACMEWINLQRSNALKHIDMDADTWDERNLSQKVTEYWRYPNVHTGEVKAAKRASATLNWLKDNDPSAMRARIAELERELGIK